jgi:asparagine synthase (glutamine-hydrolysing)
MLSGDGSDELFWGYPRLRLALAVPRRSRRARLARLIGAKRLGRPFTVQAASERAHRIMPAVDLGRVCPDVSTVPQDFDLFDAPPGLAPDPAQWVRANEVHGHLQKMLIKVDRASMYYGLEVRVPFLDLSVLACAASLDPSACMGDDVAKRPVRDALARFVPPEAIPVAKRGFSLPVGEWLRTDLRPLVHERLLVRDPFPHGLFDRIALREYVDGHLAGENRTSGVWALLTLQLWADEHLAA